MIGYATELELTNYADARGITLASSGSVLLTQALDWVELQTYKGSKTESTQVLQWPRKGVFVDGVELDSATVPTLVKELQMRMAIDIDQGNDPNSTREQAIQQETVVGAVSVTYQSGSATATLSRQVQAIMSKLGGGLSAFQFSVSRG